MATQYIVRIRNRAGVRQYDVTDFLSLNYSKTVNDVGSLRVELAGNHQAIGSLEKNGQIEVWRYDDAQGIAPYCDFYGLYRDRDRNTPGDSVNGVYTMKCLSQLYFLKCALIAFPAGTNLRNDFTADAAETIMKLMVRYNATSDATTANGRLRTVGTWATHITYAADTAAGNVLSKAYAHRNLLEALQEVAVLGGLDFDLVKTAAQTWEFRTYTLLGVDRTATVKFSLTWGNMENPSLTGGGLEEATVAIVGGAGEEAARAWAIRTGPNYVADYNDIEVFVNAAQQETSGNLDAAGDARLNELRAREELTFDVLQGGAYRYGRDYCAAGAMGDLVTVGEWDVSVVKKIREAHVSVVTSSGSQKAEQIRLDMVAV